MANPEDLGRYRLKRLLGRGALGEVWEASDMEQHGSRVAVKIMHAADDELALARSAFARESRIASLMRHPNVATFHDAGEAAGTSFLVMEMVDGKSLRTMMKDKTVELSEKLKWLRQMGDGLSAMHRAGVVHRDVKPENVIIRADRTVCLVDLGIAKWTHFDLGGDTTDDDDENPFEKAPISTNPRDSQPGIPPESDYAPPETREYQLFDEVSDQYAWAVVAYELLTGECPKETSPPLAGREGSEIPEVTAKAIDRARSLTRDDRWNGMDSLLDEIVDKTASAPVKPGSSKPPDTKPEAGIVSAPPKASIEPAPTSSPTSDEGGGTKKMSPLVIGGVMIGVALLVLIVAMAMR